MAGRGVEVRAAAGRARRRGRAWRAGHGVEGRLVWVFGSPRSGSTWLLAMLREHPAVVAINEPLIGWYLGPFLCDLPGFSSADLDSSSFTLRQAQDGKRDQFFAAEFASVWQPALATMMRRRFAAHVAHYPGRSVAPEKALVVIKEPNGSQSADMLVAALPKSRMLFLLRDGRDVVDSELAANLQGSWATKEFPGATGVSDAQRLDFVRQSAQKWLWRTEVVQRAFAQHTGPKHLLRYEDLVAAPAPALAETFAWLGLPIGDGGVEALTARHAFEALPADARGSDKFFRAATPGLWRESLTGAEQDVVHEVLGPKLAELGYA